MWFNIKNYDKTFQHSELIKVDYYLEGGNTST